MSFPSSKVPRRMAVGAVLALVMAALTVPPAAATVDPTCIVVNVDAATHYKSLQDAVDDATAGDVLKVRGTCVGHTNVDRDLTIRGRATPATGKPKLSGGKADTVVHIDEDVTVSIKNLTIRDGRGAKGDYPDTWGGGIGNDGTLTLRKVVVRNNRSEDGGGISNRGTLTLDGHTMIRHNHATNNGGGIDNDGTFRTTTLTMNDFVEVFDNTAGNGGGVNLWDSSLTMNDSSSIYSNEAEIGGGIAYGTCSSTTTGAVDGGNVHDNTPSDIDYGCP